MNTFSRLTTLILLSLLAACGGGGGDNDGGDQGTTPDPTPPSQQAPRLTPCFAAAQARGVDQLPKQPASSIAKRIIRHAAQIGGVSEPAGGCWSIPGLNNAYYSPTTDEIGYDSDFLNDIIRRAGGEREAGDSVLFHEVGHMWSHKKGIEYRMRGRIHTVDHESELQADSFAGYVLQILNGDVRPSIHTYRTVFAGWSASHPGGALRADVFLDAWLNRRIRIFVKPGGITDETEIGPHMNPDLDVRGEALERLRDVVEIRDQIQRMGLDPYSSESDEAFEVFWRTRDHAIR